MGARVEPPQKTLLETVLPWWHVWGIWGDFTFMAGELGTLPLSDLDNTKINIMKI